MLIRIKSMTIQKRILAGNLAVACLLLAPAVFVVFRLWHVGEETRESLSSANWTRQQLDQLRSGIETMMWIHRISSASGLADDPELRERVERSRATARETYLHLRPKLMEGEGAPTLDCLDALLLEPSHAPLEGDPGSVQPSGSSTAEPVAAERG